MQSLDVISVNIWDILLSLANLVLIFWIVKKLFYAPVMKMLQTRQESIEKDYDAAREAKEQADRDKARYAEQLELAKDEADTILKNAVGVAGAREKEILEEARRQADGIVRQAEAEALLAHKRAEDAVKKEIVEVSSLLTEKVLGREVTDEDHRKFIDSFVEGIGADDGTDGT